jgi:anti-sigma factor (TIGR02949 family)
MRPECDSIREHFSPWLDGELDPDTRAAVEAHLAQCSECMRELDAFKRVTELYASLEAVPAPGNFENLVRERLRPPVVQLRARRLPVRKMWPLAAAAAFLAISALVLIPRLKDSPRFEMAQVKDVAPLVAAELPEGAPKLDAQPMPARRAAEVPVPKSETEPEAVSPDLAAQLEALEYVGLEPDRPAASEKKLPAAPEESSPPPTPAATTPATASAVAMPSPAPPPPAPAATEERHARTRALPGPAPAITGRPTAPPPLVVGAKPMPVARQERAATAESDLKDAAPEPMPAPMPAAQMAPAEAISEPGIESTAGVAGKAAELSTAADETGKAVVAGKTFVREGNLWREESYAGEKALPLLRDSARYHTLEQTNPEIRLIAALGPEAIFYLNDLWYHLKPPAAP